MLALFTVHIIRIAVASPVTTPYPHILHWFVCHLHHLLSLNPIVAEKRNYRSGISCDVWKWAYMSYSVFQSKFRRLHKLLRNECNWIELHVTWHIVSMVGPIGVCVCGVCLCGCNVHILILIIVIIVVGLVTFVFGLVLSPVTSTASSVCTSLVLGICINSYSWKDGFI